MISTVKLLNGDIVQVENVDPSLGFFGVSKILSQIDPETFPIGLTTLCYADEQNPQLENLIAIVTPPIESVDRVIELGGRYGFEKYYQFVIKVDRRKSTSVFKNFKDLMLCELNLDPPQLFDIFYFPKGNEFYMPTHGSSDPSTYSPGILRARRFPNVHDALHESVHYIKEDADGESIIEEVQFTLNEFAIHRIGSMINKWIEVYT
jgi:hypothetical protein